MPLQMTFPETKTHDSSNLVTSDIVKSSLVIHEKLCPRWDFLEEVLP